MNVQRIGRGVVAVPMVACDLYRLRCLLCCTKKVHRPQSLQERRMMLTRSPVQEGADSASHHQGAGKPLSAAAPPSYDGLQVRRL